MGWSDGTGLGKHCDGKTDNIRVRAKNNNMGIGADGKKDDQLMAMQLAFDTLLGDLAQSHAAGVDASKVKATSQREDMVAASRTMFYSRFLRSKDASKYSDADMASIIGSRSSTPVGETSSSVSSPDAGQAANEGEATTTSNMSIGDYFAMKMAQRKTGLAGKASGVDDKEDPVSETQEDIGDDKAIHKKGKKKKNKDARHGKELELVQDEVDIERKRSKKSGQKKAKSTNRNDGLDTDHVATSTQASKDKKKKKKRVLQAEQEAKGQSDTQADQQTDTLTERPTKRKRSKDNDSALAEAKTQPQGTTRPEQPKQKKIRRKREKSSPE